MEAIAITVKINIRDSYWYPFIRIKKRTSKAIIPPFEYKFTVLNNENVWAKAMNRIINEKVPVDKATDEMIERIKTVAR